MYASNASPTHVNDNNYRYLKKRSQPFKGWLPLLLVVFLLVAGCKKGEQKIAVAGRHNDGRKLVITDTLLLPLDSLTGPHHYYGQVRYLASDTLYIIFNEYNNSLQAYSLVSGRQVWHRAFPAEGPWSVTARSRFYFHNDDSVFFIEEYPYNTIRLFNARGEPLSSWKIELPVLYEEYWISLLMFCDYFYNNGVVYFCVCPDASQATHAFYEKAVMGAYSLKTQEYAFFGGFPPLFYTTEAVYDSFDFIEFYLNGNNLIAYFHPTDEVDIYSLPDLQLRQKIRIPSRFIEQPTKPLKQIEEEEKDIQEEKNYLMTEPYYVRMLTAPGGGYHYRIVKLRTSLLDNSGKLRDFYDKPFSIMVLDSAFTIIDEVKFAGGEFDFYQTFAAGNKLYVSFNNPLNPSSSDSVMQFAVFTLK